MLYSGKVLAQSCGGVLAWPWSTRKLEDLAWQALRHEKTRRIETIQLIPLSFFVWAHISTKKSKIEIILLIHLTILVWAHISTKKMKIETIPLIHLIFFVWAASPADQ